MDEVRRALAWLTIAGVIAAAAAVLGGFAGGAAWWLDLLAHFRVQYAVALVAAVAVLALLRRWRWAALAGAVLAIDVVALAPLWLASPAAAAAGGPALRVAAFNVHHANPRVDELARYLRWAAPDVLVVLEVDAAMATALDGLEGYRGLVQPRGDAFGIAALTRRPLHGAAVRLLGGAELPAIELALELDGRRVEVLAVHTMPPVGAAEAALRDRMLGDAAAWARGRPGAIVVGDLNATPWSHAFRGLVDDGGLVSSHRGHGLQTTWPRELWPLSIPIDHLLHGSELTTVERFTGPFLGSDHRALHVVLAPTR